MKEMKIKVSSYPHFKIVAEALAGAGYQDIINAEHFQEARGLYAHASSAVTYTLVGEDYFFEGHDYPEYFLVNGKFITADEYFVYPATPYSEDKTTYEPLPDEGPSAPTIAPRVEFLRQRNVELLQSMLVFVNKGMKIPQEWVDELSINNSDPI